MHYPHTVRALWKFLTLGKVMGDLRLRGSPCQAVDPSIKSGTHCIAYEGPSSVLYVLLFDPGCCLRAHFELVVPEKRRMVRVLVEVARPQTKKHLPAPPSPFPMEGKGPREGQQMAIGQ